MRFCGVNAHLDCDVTWTIRRGARRDLMQVHIVGNHVVLQFPLP